MRRCVPADWNGMKCNNCGSSTATEHRKLFKSEQKRIAVLKGFDNVWHQEMYDCVIDGYGEALDPHQLETIKKACKILNDYGYRA